MNVTGGLEYNSMWKPEKLIEVITTSDYAIKIDKFKFENPKTFIRYFDQVWL